MYIGPKETPATKAQATKATFTCCTFDVRGQRQNRAQGGEGCADRGREDPVTAAGACPKLAR